MHKKLLDVINGRTIGVGDFVGLIGKFNTLMQVYSVESKHVKLLNVLNGHNHDVLDSA